MAFRALSAISLVLLFFCSCSDEGKPQFYNIDSTTISEEHGILYAKGKGLNGVVFQLTKNGDTIFRSQYKKGLPDGLWKNWFENGKLHEMRWFSNGSKTGDYTVYWENGTKKQQCHFEKGEYDGSYSEWNSNGKLIRQMHYKNGYEKGSQKLFYDNGSIRANYVVIDGRRYGLLGTKNCVNASDSIFKK
ncbi:toxin-antitoxin system YwqK family antitoxin [Flavobacterium silvaticum]|uniref:Toxin-antitoxin system YwqK family antitoxin n=1 Tax=Flavobacterium silvaticum TaxID=1852020 RepID=A0A972JIQ4_9FLAO|nr:toxin-antitoxin system YwqK family antitoxin [Flavobacterium silvaticum]NMH28528.1 toxin-antitoxin system YwqK family antitoxin [Flavobacterium silvaticum]